MQNLSEVGGHAAAATKQSSYRGEDEPDVTASINVDDEMIRGTTSVQQSHDGLPTGGVANTFINVHHSNDPDGGGGGGEGRKRAVLSQADQRDAEVRTSNFVVSDRTQEEGQDPRSMQMNETVGKGTSAAITDETPLSETVRADNYQNTAAGLRVSFEDDWKGRPEGASSAYPATENRSNQPNIILSSHQASSEIPTQYMRDQETPAAEETVQASQDADVAQNAANEAAIEAVADSEEDYSDDNDHVAELPNQSSIPSPTASSPKAPQQVTSNPQQELTMFTAAGDAEIRECDLEQSYSDPEPCFQEEDGYQFADSMISKEAIAANTSKDTTTSQSQTNNKEPVQRSASPPIAIQENDEAMMAKDDLYEEDPEQHQQNVIVQDELERLIVNLNHTAMTCLKNDKFDKAKQLLTKAENNLLKVDTQVAELQATSRSIGNLGDPQFAKRAGIGPLDALKNRLLGLTYNNLGCLCKQQQDFQGALAFLKQALAYESRLEDQEEADLEADLNEDDFDQMAFQMDLRTLRCNSAGTILNICAILSKLKLHKQALEYANEAILKLRHSMRLTKTQVLHVESRLNQGQQKLADMQSLRNKFDELEDGSSVEQVQDPEVTKMQEDIQRLKGQKIELESQWVNLATTAVIAHYNAAVELEFMSQWREALADYEKSAQLSALAMKANNPMAIKIKQAIIKMRIKVRNKVQLPDKLALEGPMSKRKAGKSYMGSSKMTAQAAALKDFQNSVTSGKSSQFQQQFNRLATAQQQSHEYRFETSPRSPTTQPFYPGTSLDNPVQSLESATIVQKPATGMKDQMSSNQSNKVALRPLINRSRQTDKSPISLRKIIDRLEQTEMMEARKQQTAGVAVPKHRRFASSRNPPQIYTTGSNIGSANDDTISGLTSAFNERKGSNPPLSTNLRGGGYESRNSNARHNLNSAGVNNIVDPNFLPSLTPIGPTSGCISTRNNGRGSTVSGLRPVKQPSYAFGEQRQQLGTSMPKQTRLAGGSKPPLVTTNAWGGTPTESVLQTSQRQPPNRATSVGESSKFNTIDGGVSSHRKHSVNLSPARIQMQLSITQERRLIEQQRRLGTNQSKREQDINFFLSHLKRQGPKSKKSTRTTMLNTISTDLESVRQQIMFESSASHLAGSAYLPTSLKKSIKQRQFVSQIKTMQRQINKEIGQLQPDPTQQMETNFQRQMALWKQEREQQIEEQKQKQSVIQEKQQFKAQLADHLSAAEVARQGSIQDSRNSQQSADVLSAEQAQEAVSMTQDSHTKLTDKQGGYEEEEVGNFRVSPAQTAGVKKNNLEMATLVGHGQIQILDEYGANEPDQKNGDLEEERPDTRAEVVLDKNDSTPGDPQGAAGTSGVIISEYHSSRNGTTENIRFDTAGGDACSGTAQEVELEQPARQLSETIIEVEDIVSADTNNRQLDNNFQSYRTSSNILRNNGTGRGDTTPQGRVINHKDLFKSRINNNSAIHAEENADLNVNRSQNVRSSFAMTTNLEDHVRADDSLKNKHESMTAVSPVRLKNEPTISQQVHTHHEVTFSKKQNMRQSQITAGESSIAESNGTQTDMTVEENPQNKMIGEITLNEETLDGWKLQKDINGSHRSQLHDEIVQPELTDDQVTVLAEQSQIGDGPIFIQKSAEHSNIGGGRSTNRVSKNKTSNLMDDMLQQRPHSRQVSEVTGTTEQIRYQTDSMMGIYNTQKTQKQRMKNERDSLAQQSLAQTSEVIPQTKMIGGFSVEEGHSIGDTASDGTCMQGYSQGRKSLAIQDIKVAKNHQMQGNQSPVYVTPRTNAFRNVKQSGKTDAYARSSQETEHVTRALPGHINHSKKSGSRKPPTGAGGGGQQTKRYVAVLAQKQQSKTNRPSFVKPLNLGSAPASRNAGQQVQTTKSTNIPQMIHIQQQNVTSPNSNGTSPKAVTRRKTVEVVRHNDEVRASKDGAKPRVSAALEAVVDYSGEDQIMNVKTLEGDKATSSDQQTQDRVAKIAQQITKLNTTLLQFQTEAEELKKDPMLKSTQRSNQSRHGLISQKSRDTNMTMPVADPAQVKALQEKRLIAQLQSAPGRSRRGRESYMTDGQGETSGYGMGMNPKPSETPLAVRKQTTTLSGAANDFRNDVTVQSEIKSVETNQ